MNPDDIRPQHWQRLAYVYIRQSSLHQVLHHRESRRRQQAFQQRALQLGWPADRIRVVEEDLGQSGARHQRRSGFEDLVAQVALAAVGLILALEVSRLARGNRDGYHLLDICSITGTLIADAEGLYDPREYNDRLLLGLKGTLGEAELHLMKQRLVEAMRAKAARGEFRFRLPPGYFWGEAGRMQKEVDAQVRSALESIFRRFERLGTIHQVHTALVEEGQQVPVRRGRGRQIGWTLPSYGSLARVLKNPLYAGAYVWGRRQVEESLDEAQRAVKRVRERPREDWPVLIPDHHPGYISWEEFEKNQAQIRANYRGPAQVGAPREGRSLLQGLILCGLCGRRMGVAYSYGSGTFRDRCVERREQRGVPVCQSFGAVRLEEAVEALLLEALQPLALEAMIEAAATVERTSEAQREQLQQRRQRARYEVDLARRQYEAVDPDHRLVAQELERRWEQALEDLQRVEEQTEEQLRALERPLEPQEQQRLRHWSRNLGSLWHEPTMRVQDKKRLLRCLIEQVVVRVEEAELQAQVHWVGGEVTPVAVRMRKRGEHRWVTDPELVELIRTLAQEFSDEQIAWILSTKRLRTSKGLPFTATRVSRFRYPHGLPGTKQARLEDDHVYSPEQAAALLEVNRGTVIRWIQAGLLRGSQLLPEAPWKVEVTGADLRRLKATDAPPGWLPLKGAAQALGVSQQTVLQRLKSGQLEGVRVRVGRRSSWRIRVSSTTYDKQPPLFSESTP